jgi:hypothetical protein
MTDERRTTGVIAVWSKNNGLGKEQTEAVASIPKQRMRYSAPVTHLNPADPPAERGEHGPSNEITAAVSVIIVVIGDVIVWVSVAIIVRPA